MPAPGKLTIQARSIPLNVDLTTLPRPVISAFEPSWIWVVGKGAPRKAHADTTRAVVTPAFAL
jgi:hypothetical protein